MARLEIQIGATNVELKKILKESKDLLSQFSTGFDTKPLTAYQAGLLKIKQEALELTKQKDADKKSQQALNAEIKNQAKALKEANAEAARKGKDRSFPASNTDAINKATQATKTLIVTQDRSVKSDNLQVNSMNAKYVAYAKLSTAMAKQASAQSQLTPVVLGNTSAVNNNANAQRANNTVKSKSALILAEEKAAQARSTAELKNFIRETNSAKGSLEQRRAALERLTIAYGKLSAAERQAASGQRLSTIIKDLGVQINKIDPTKIQRVASEMKKIPATLPGSSAASGGIFSDLFGSISNGALSSLAPVALLTAALTGLREVASHNIAISDSFGDVRRTAKLSSDEVNQYAKELKGLDTRSSLEGLLDIGFIGGRLGVVKKDLTDFTKQVDELSVVLKKEFPGGADAVAESLGKIVTIYKITQSEGVSLGTALSKVGSTLLELAHAGPVTVKYLQDFTLGVAGTAASAKLSVPIISAYGAVLGESGQIASSAALSVTRLVSGLTTKTGKYAAIAQLADSTLTVEKFTKIVNTDTKQALDLFFKGLKAGNPVATEFAARLGSIGITTGKVTNSVKILAENQDKLNNRIEKAKVAFDEGTSVAHNFEVANNTLGASVDKLGNSIVNLTTNPNGNMANFFKGLVDGATKSVNALSILTDTIAGLTTDPKKFIADSAKTSRSAADEAMNANAKRSAVIAIKNLGDQKKSLDLLKNEVKIRDIIQNQFLAAKIAYANINPKNRTLADTEKFQEIEKKFRFQIALVKSLNTEFARLYRTRVTVEGDGSIVDNLDDNTRTIDDIKADIKRVTALKKPLDTASKQYQDYLKQLIGFKKELKIAEGFIPKAPSTSGVQKTSADIVAKSMSDANLAGLEGNDQEVERIRQKYAKFYTDLDTLAKKSGANRQQIDSDRLIIQGNEAKEIGQLIVAEKEREASEIDRINQVAGIKAAENQQKEILAINKRYDDEIAKAGITAKILAALEFGKQNEIANVNQKYADKRSEAEQKVYDKIADITEKGFTDNVKRTVQGSARIDAQLKERLASLQKYFDELRKLNEGNPLGVMALNVQQEGESRKLKSGAVAAKSPKTDLTDLFDQDLKAAATKFGSDFSNILKNVARTGEETLGQAFGRLGTSIFESLSTSVSDIFVNQFKTQFSDAIKGASDKLSTGLKGAIAGAGLLGGAISGLSKPTSGVGQGIGGAISGAATGAGAAIGIGAAIGTAAGPIGIGIGAAVGGLVGLFSGIFGASKRRKEEALQKAQLEEQKKQTALMERQNALAYASSIIGRNTTSGIVTGVDVNEFGQVITKVSGSDLLIIHDKAVKSRQRGI